MGICTLRVSGASFDVARFAAQASFPLTSTWNKGQPVPSVYELMTGKPGSKQSVFSDRLCRDSGFRVEIVGAEKKMPLEEQLCTARKFLEIHRASLASLDQNFGVEEKELEFSFTGPGGNGTDSPLAAILRLSKDFVKQLADLGIELEITIWNSDMMR